MTIQFCGAAGEVTGSAHLITLDDGYKILLDCGLYQGHAEEMEGFNRQWYFKPGEIDCLILSHAHIDHSGRIPKLVKDGFQGDIHCTHATRSLCSIMLLDSAKIQEWDAEYENKRRRKKGQKGKQIEPLYQSRHVQQAMQLFVSYGYERWFSIEKRVEVFFRDAGHILGSASVSLRIREKGKTITLGFTGDVGRPRRPILRDPQPMPEADYVISESTYGNREHEAAPAETERFLKIIKETCVDKKGKLIIPAFSVGRTQEVVYLLDQLETEGRLPRIPVFVDSPLAVDATMIFGAHPECFDSDLNEYMLIDKNPFGFNDLTYIKDSEASKRLNSMEEACIIISSSGMMNAGRVRHHLFHNIDHSKNTFLIVGYCAPDTPGGMLRDGVKSLKIFGERKSVKAKIEVMDSFSAHADRLELLDFLKNQRDHAKKVFLVHGTPDRQEPFRESLLQYGFKDVQLPTLGEVVALH